MNEWPLYYKILVGDDGRLKVVELQDFDEPDYDQSRFFSQVQFQREGEAQAIIDAIYKWLGQRYVHEVKSEW